MATEQTRRQPTAQTGAAGFSYTPLRRQLATIEQQAPTQMCAYTLGDYATYRAAGKLALQPGVVMAKCTLHGTRHLYDRDLWQTWLNQARAELMMSLPPRLASEVDRNARHLIQTRIKAVRIAQLRLELPFYAWQADKIPQVTPEPPAGMSQAEYRRLTREPLLIPVAAMPDDLLVEFQQCARKARFRTATEAEAFRRKKIAGGMAQVKEQEIYNCSYCGGLHLGKPRNDGSNPRYQENQVRSARKSWNTFRKQANDNTRQIGLI